MSGTFCLENSPDQGIVLGKIVGVFGIKGWLKIQSFADPPENILSYKHWHLINSQNHTIEVDLESGCAQGKGIIAKLKGCSDRDSAETFLGYEIRVAASDLPELAEGEYYWHQLEGLSVSNLEGAYLGDISHLLETGVHDVLVLKPSADSNDCRERLIPYLPGKTVLRVGINDKRMIVDWEVDY